MSAPGFRERLWHSSSSHGFLSEAQLGFQCFLYWNRCEAQVLEEVRHAGAHVARMVLFERASHSMHVLVDVEMNI